MCDKNGWGSAGWLGARGTWIVTRGALKISRDGGNTLTDTLSPYFESGVDNTTTECYYRVGRWNGLTGEFIGYDCKNNVSAGFFRGVGAQAYYYPGGKKALLNISSAESNTTMLTEFEKCPWAQVDRGINTEECRSVRYQSGDQSGRLYEVDLTTGQRTQLMVVSGRHVATAAVSEADDEIMLMELRQSGGYDMVPKQDSTVGFTFENVQSSTTNCQAAWYPLTGSQAPFRVVSQDFCDMGFEGGGTIAPLRRKDPNGAPVIPGLVLRPRDQGPEGKVTSP